MGCASSAAASSSNDEQLKTLQREMGELRSKLSMLEEEAALQKDISAKAQSQVKVLQADLDSAHQTISQLRASAPIQLDESHLHTKVDGDAPKVGDAVISHWSSWSFYKARIAAVDPVALTYTVDFDDGDPQHRVQKMEHVALDRVPDATDIGVGSIVIFPQGSYGSYGGRGGGVHWHLGEITGIRTEDGTTLYDGKHAKTQEDGKDFVGLELDQLRVAPNLFGAVSQCMGADTSGTVWPDVFLMYHNANCHNLVLTFDETEDLPSYDAATAASTDPREIKEFLESSGLSCWVPQEHPDATPDVVAKAIQNAKVVIACISNEFSKDPSTRSMFQFAKKIAQKPTVPIIVGSGPGDWKVTVVGFLISGELYIDFQDTSLVQSKLQELLASCQGIIHGTIVRNPTHTHAPEAQRVETDVFISYCWNNSMHAQQQDRIQNVTGTPHNDPRMIKQRLIAMGYKAWIDIEQLESGGAGLFEEIAEGLKATKVVIAFVSKEYAMSENCRTEIQFALKSLHKPVVPVVIGLGEDWKPTVVGMLTASHTPIDLQGAGEADLEIALREIDSRIKKEISEVSPEDVHVEDYADEGLQVGDKVISHWVRWQFYTARIIALNKQDRTVEVHWDDNDVSGRVQPMHLVAKDKTPLPDEIGIGSTVFFPQGNYRGDANYNRDAGTHWHLGIIEDINTSGDHVLYSGKHTRGDADGKWTTFKGYSPTFTGLKLEDLRVSPNLMATLAS